MKRIPRLLLAASTVATLGAAAATSFAEAPTPGVDIVRSTQQGHAFQSGGIGDEDVRDMIEHRAGYDLRLTFSEGRYNDYVTGLKLRVLDAQGRRVFSYDEAGPLTDVALPAGHYRVVADFGGVERSGTVDLKPGAPAELYLHWPKDES